MSFFFFFPFFCFSSFQISLSPTWIESNKDVINNLTGSGIPLIYTFTFGSNFSEKPHLGYGIKKYEGNDYLGEEIFEIERKNLTESAFTVLVQIIGFTNLWKLNVAYIAIDKAFTHNLNSFDNLPLNQSAGDLVNITERSFQETQYKNTINYTKQAQNTEFRQFSNPLNENRVLLFITGIQISSFVEEDELPWYQIQFNVEAVVTSSSEYQITVSLLNNTYIRFLEFSSIIFNNQGLKQSQKYIQSEKLSISQNGSFLQIPSQFAPGFFMGLTDFSGIRGNTVLHFNWMFQNIDGVFGVHIQPSTPTSPYLQYKYGLQRQGVTFMYLKAWTCPKNNFLDLMTDLCYQCLVQNCILCENETYCSECNEEQNYFLNISTGECLKCQIQDCLNCSSLYECKQYNQSFTDEEITFNILNIQKRGCNSFILELQIEQKQKFDLSSILNVLDSIDLISERIGKFDKSYHEERGVILFNIYYIDDLFLSSLSLEQPSMQNLSFSYNPFIPPAFYSQRQCESSSKISLVVKSIFIVSLILLLLAFFSGSKIIVVEFIGILQLTFISLSNSSFINIYMASFNLKFINGYNEIQLFEEETSSSSLKWLNLSTSFINNFNFMFIVLLGDIFIAVLIKLVSHFKKSEIADKISQFLLKQFLLILILFNSQNIGFSAGIHWKSGSENIISNLTLYISLLFILANTVSFVFTSSEGYGEFSNRQKVRKVGIFYICLTILFKLISTTLFISQNTDYEKGLFIAILIFLVSSFGLLPFEAKRLNIQIVMVNLGIPLTSSVNFYYRSMEERQLAHNHIPALILVAYLGLNLITISIMMIYQLHIMIKEGKTNKVSDEQEKEEQFMHKQKTTMTVFSFSNVQSIREPNRYR